MSGYNFEISGIDDFLKNINDIKIEKIKKKYGVYLFINTKKRTPVDKGQLRRSWKLKYKKGNLYIQLYNNTEYGLSI